MGRDGVEGLLNTQKGEEKKKKKQNVTASPVTISQNVVRL